MRELWNYWVDREEDDPWYGYDLAWALWTIIFIGGISFMTLIMFIAALAGEL